MMAPGPGPAREEAGVRRDGSFRVLLGVDGQRPSFLAEELVRALVDRERCDVTVVCSNSFDMSLHQSEVLGLGRYSPEAGYRHAVSLVDAAVERLRADGIRAAGKVREGDPVLALLAAARTASADLVVAGAGTASWAGIPLLGRVAGRLLADAPCSVVVVRSWLSGVGGVPVLLATDGSPGAEHALRAFACFADPARCHVVVAGVARPAHFELWGPLPADAEAGAGRDDAALHVAAAAGLLADRGFSCTQEVAEGRAAEALLQVGERHGCRLVVAGSRGLGPVRGMVMGSVSDKLARSAPAVFVGRIGMLR